MHYLKNALLYVVLLAVLLEPIAGRRGFGGSHSYPKSGGLSGGGHRSGGLSGGGHGYPSGGSHGYPSSGGLSGGGHGYPSSGGSRYPSGGSAGYPSGGNHGYPSSGGSHTYPSSGGSHGYPASGGLSGHGSGYKPAGTHTTHVYNNYHYSPPPQISYSPVRGAPPVSYPVYHGSPPTYVYQYKDSGSKYGTLLAGLALLNLGTLGAAAYAVGRTSSSHHSYTPQPGEVCKFAIKKDNGDYEETKIDCSIISSFILQDQAEREKSGTNSTITTTVTNTTIVNMTNVMPEQPTPTPTTVAPVLFAMLPNGTLVPVNASAANIPGLTSPVNVTQNETAATSPNGTMTSSVTTITTTTTNTTLVNALDVKGKPVDVTPGMQCFVIRNSPTSNMRKTVPCGLLQTYAEKSIRTKGSAARNGPVFTVIAVIVALLVAY